MSEVARLIATSGTSAKHSEFKKILLKCAWKRTKVVVAAAGAEPVPWFYVAIATHHGRLVATAAAPTVATATASVSATTTAVAATVAATAVATTAVARPLNVAERKGVTTSRGVQDSNLLGIE